MAKKHITVRIEPEIEKELRRLAKGKRMSFSEYVRALIYLGLPDDNIYASMKEKSKKNLKGL
jgi:mRNA-degrading endonuclease RelE of RelBE toxin-antitoxin system